MNISGLLMSLNKEWILVLAVCSIPFLLFGAAELAGMVRQRRLEAIARRSKSPSARNSASRKAPRPGRLRRPSPWNGGSI